jgi:hypothetical protein
MLRHVTAMGCIFAVTAASAEPVPLSGEAIREMVRGAAFELDTPLGTKIPIRFSEDGLLSGEAGELAAVLGAAKDRGRWWISGDELCHKWFRWFDAEVHCLRLSRDGARLHWVRDDGKTGTATIASRTEPSVTASNSSVIEPAAAKPAEPPDALGAQEAEKAPSESAAPSPTPRQFARAEAFSFVTAATAAPAESAAKPAVKITEEPQSPSSHETRRTVEKAPAAQADPPKVRISSFPPKAPPVTQGVSFRVTGVDEDDVLNVRAGPSSEHPLVGVVSSSGRDVKLAGACVAEWCPIKHHGVSGWVNRLYLAEETAPRGSAAPTGHRSRADLE